MAPQDAWHLLPPEAQQPVGVGGGGQDEPAPPTKAGLSAASFSEKAKEKEKKKKKKPNKESSQGQQPSAKKQCLSVPSLQTVRRLPEASAFCVQCFRNVSKTARQAGTGASSVTRGDGWGWGGRWGEGNRQGGLRSSRVGPLRKDPLPCRPSHRGRICQSSRPQCPRQGCPCPSALPFSWAHPGEQELGVPRRSSLEAAPTSLVQGQRLHLHMDSRL